MDSVKYATAPEIDTRRTTGHELFHHVQYGYINDGTVTGCNSTWSKWTCEGTARMMQDEVYADLDADPGTTNAAYVNQINGYLTNTGNLNTTLTGLSYNAALFWRYLSEQLGSVATEPQRGVDAIVAFWQNASNTKASPDSLQVLRDTISGLQPGMTLEELWQDFVIANYAKDLDVSALADADKYGYIDDDATPYGSVATTSSASFSPSTAIGPAAASVNSYAARYHVGQPSASCNILGFQSTGDQAGYGMIVVTGASTAARLAFINRPSDLYTALVATVAPAMTTPSSAATPGSRSSVPAPVTRPMWASRRSLSASWSSSTCSARRRVSSPSTEGLDTSVFTVYVGAEDPANQATILSGAYVQGSYWLVAQAPVKAAMAPIPCWSSWGSWPRTLKTMWSSTPKSSRTRWWSSTSPAA